MKTYKLLILLSLCVFLISCSAEINVTTSEMNVKQGETDIPCTTGYFDFGNIPLHYSQTITFTIENIGVSDLELTSVEKVQIIGKNADEFELILDQTVSLILPDSDTEFSVKFNPKSMGTKTATISIPNNDKDENPYTFVVVGNCTPPAPEMHVVQDTKDILCATGSFDFGFVAVNTSSVKTTFTIQNNGDEDLNLTGTPDIITKSGVDPDMFIIDQTNTSTPVLSGSSTTFDITFNPTSPGVKSAKISILNDDSDENPYTFTIAGTGVAATEINVKQGSDDILSGTGKYSFSDTLINGSFSEITFTIENLGTAILHLSNKPDYVKISGIDATMFSLNLTSTDEDIAPGHSTTFGITFEPTSLGDKSATVTIQNNDVDENPYTFTLEGKCVASEINIKHGSDDIANSTGEFYLPGIRVNQSTNEIELTIENKGDGNLELTGSPIIEISGADASQFSLNTSLTSSTVTPSNSTTFKLMCTPTSKGLKTATISIVNNDLDENPYTFTIYGFGVIYTEGDVNGDGLADMVVGSCLNDAGGTDAGRVYIFFGKSNWNSSYDASNADVIITGEDGGDEFGYSISMTGDVNDDGFEDLVVGAHFDDDGGDKSGCALIFFGRYNWKSSVDASEANVKLVGEDAGDQFGTCVTCGGDVNSDGINDTVVGAVYDCDGGIGSGCVFIFFGRTQWSSSIDASAANVKIIGEDRADNLGESISISGDVNDDGVEDIVVGAYGNDEGAVKAGAAYIFFGRSNWTSSIDASNANVKLIGEDADDWFGRRISSGGDVNNDGIDDIVIGAYYDDDGGTSSGCAFIFFGRTVWVSKIDASIANVKLIGEDSGDSFGRNVNCTKDINNDGLHDIIIGAQYDDDGGENSGVLFIFFGKLAWSSSIDASLADVKLIGEDIDDRMGSSISIMPDINNDGICDIVVGAYGDDDGGSMSGSAYIFFGRSNWISVIDASNFNVKFIGEEASDRLSSSYYGN